MKNYVIVTGVGRSGTTFLMQLFTELELDTGFENPNQDVFQDSHCGMEWNLNFDGTDPYIVKGPRYCSELGPMLKRGDVHVDAVIIPVRRLGDAAKSRCRVQQMYEARGEGSNLVPGGLWKTMKPEEQEAVLCREFYKLMETVVSKEMNYQLLSFPRMIQDPRYLYWELMALESLDLPSLDDFVEAFETVVRPQYIHEF